MKSNDLSKWVKKYPAGRCLFTTDDAGANVFLIIKGLVQLFRVADQVEELVGTVGAGDVLGEKALLSDKPYQHSLTARIKSPLEVIEFEPKDLPLIEEKIPDFKMRLLETVTSRLSKANKFIRILRTRDKHERIARYIHYYMTYNHIADGESALTISVADVSTILDIDQEATTESLEALVTQHALQEKDGQYLIHHMEVLENQIGKWDKRIR